MTTENKTRSVEAVLVVYNTKKERLEKILRAVSGQTVLPQSLVVWDNSSKKEIAETVAAYAATSKVRMEYVASENVGAGAGFKGAIDHVYSSGRDFEWIWMLEDDVCPEAACLETLLSFEGLSGFLCPRRRFASGTYADDDSFFDPRFQNHVRMAGSFTRNPDRTWVPVTFHTFEGVLVRKDVYEKIDPPNTECFLFHDDTLFTFLGSLKENLVLVRDAELEVLKSESEKDLSPRTLYYMNRNLFLLVREIKKAGMLPPIYQALFYVIAVYRFFKYSWYAIWTLRSWKAFRYNCIAFYHGAIGRYGRYA